MNDPFAGPGRGRGAGAPESHDESRRLVEENLDYVRALARTLHQRCGARVEYDELVAMGNEGLVRAARDFDPMRGASFKTYAFYKIRGAIFEGLRMMSWSRRSRAAIRIEESRDAVAEELAGVAEGTGSVQSPELEIARLEDGLLRGIRRLAVIRLVADFHDGDETPADTADPGDASERREMHGRLAQAMERLDPEDRGLVTSLYVECKSMTDYAHELGVNKSTVTRRHAAVLESLRRLICGEEMAGSAGP